MRKIQYIFLAAALALTACHRDELPVPTPNAKSSDDAKVAITFPVAIPVNGLSTKAMADEPQVENIYVAVFGGSGYFNEWVRAEVVGTEMAEYNYRDYEDSDNHDYKIYKLAVRLSMSDSRLRLHVIANCPVGDPPITGVSSEDTEDVVMSKVRSQIGEKNNDAYWQKIILPIGIRAVTEITNGVEQYKLDENGDRIPTVETIAQFDRHSPIPLVRNFARICLITKTTDVTIDRFCLAYAPKEGPVAPILPGMYYSDVWGEPVTGESDYKETFFINYQDHPLTSNDPSVKAIGDAPFNYTGYTPGDLKFGTYPSSLEEMTPWSKDTYLYVYERSKPRVGQKATRVIIHAKKGNEAWKYYPLDIVDATDGGPAALMRNYTYVLELTEIAPGTGQETIAKAADATAANVSADPRTADLNEVSDGTAMIATSYIDTTAIKADKYSVMYRFVPVVANNNKTESNNPSTTPTGVTLKFGYNDGNGFVEGANSANGNAFASDPKIETNTNGSAKLYVRNGNGWSVATDAQISDTSIEKWGRINYTTVGTAGSAFDKAYTKVIRVIGIKGNGTQIYRDVQVNLIPRKDMVVKCLDKYVADTIGASETVRIYIPDDLTRSMFPVEFKLQPEAGSLTPREGDNLPVQSGKSIVPGKETQSAYFFVKTLTRQQYESLPTEEVDGKTLKYFDCKFKSSKANSATTVYVSSEYFNEKSDDFENYTGRLFTNLTFSHSVTSGADVNFSFTMDAAHNGREVVFNEGTSNQRVLPQYVTVTLTGLQPAANGDQLIDTRLTRITNGVYKYQLSGLNDFTPTLHLTASPSAERYSVTLSTSEITPNPNLYTPASIEGEIVKSKITGIHFENDLGKTITNVLAVKDEPVYFCFTYGGAQVPVTFKLNGLAPNDTPVSGSGTYTYTPTASGAQKILMKTTTDLTNVSVTDFTVSSESYTQPSPNTFTLERIRYNFAGGFTKADGTTPATSARKADGEDVYFTLNYDSDPVPVTFSLTGLEPAADQSGITVNGGVYTFTPTGTERGQVIHFKTTDAETTCVLSGLAPTTTAYTNPDPASFSLERRNRRWVTGSYTIDLTDYALYYQTTFADQVSGTTVSFANCDYSRDYTYMGTRTGGIGNRTYYNGSYVVTAPSESRITGITMAYYTEGYYYTTTYNYLDVTVAGDVSTSSTLTGDKTTWNSSSTGEGNGDNTVTVTMSCTRDYYDYRNRLTSLTVRYGYWSED